MLSRAVLGLAFVLTQVSAAVFVIRDATLIDGTGKPPAPHTTIVVRGERIAAIGPAAKMTVPKGARIIEGRGRFVIPGLWDMHVHLWEKQNPLPVYIAYGVTGVRDMGSDFDRTVKWRQAAETGKAIGPHVVTSGPAVDGRPSREPKLPVIVAATPEDGRRAFDRLDEMDVDFIKVLSSLPHDSFIALAERARKWRMAFAGHVPATVTVDEALDARISSMEHLFGLFAACAKDQTRRLETFDERKARDLFRKSALMETRQTPTLTLWERMAYIGVEERVRDPRMRHVPASVRASWPKPEEEIKGAAAEGIGDMRRQTDLAMRMVKMMQECGVEIMAGTDTGDPYTVPGFTLHRELELLVKAGLTPMQALRSATAIPAKYLDWDESVGTVKKGMVADLVLLDANPLADIRNVARIHGVSIRGRYLTKAWITQTLAAVK